jgi:DNA-binding PadR family transcriptional regulator
MRDGAYFLIIPSSVDDNPDIPDQVTLLFGLLVGLSDRHGYSFASNATLARLRGVSVSTVKRWLALLREHGYITVEIAPNSMRRIYPTITPTPRQKQRVAEIKASQPMQIDPEVSAVLDSLWKRI